MAARDELVKQIPTDANPVQGGERIDSSELGRTARNLTMALPMGRGVAGAGQAAAAFAGKAAGAGLGAGVAAGSALARPIAAVAPYVPAAGGAAALYAGSAPPAVAQAPAQAPGTVAAPAAAPMSSAQQLADPGSIKNAERGGTAFAMPPQLGGVTGAPVDNAPGVSKFKQGGKTLYSNVPGTQDNDQLMSGKGGTVSAMPSAAGVLMQQSGSPALDSQLAAARLAAANRGDFGAVASSYGGNFGGGASAQSGNPLMDQISGGMQAGKQLTARGAQALLELQRNQTGEAQQRTAATQLAMEAPGKQADAQAKQLAVRSAQDVEQARQQYLTAQTPEAKQAAEANLRALRGEKEVPELFSTQVMQGQVDALGNRSPAVAVVTDKRTGATRLMGVDGKEINGQAAPVAMPKSKGELKVGTTYQTPRGAAKWDGSNFIPVAQ